MVWDPQIEYLEQLYLAQIHLYRLVDDLRQTLGLPNTEPFTYGDKVVVTKDPD